MAACSPLRTRMASTRSGWSYRGGVQCAPAGRTSSRSHETDSTMQSVLHYHTTICTHKVFDHVPHVSPGRADECLVGLAGSCQPVPRAAQRNTGVPIVPFRVAIAELQLENAISRVRLTVCTDIDSVVVCLVGRDWVTRRRSCLTRTVVRRVRIPASDLRSLDRRT